MPQYISQFAVTVRDYDEALAFYVDKLGFEKLEDTDLGGGKRWVRVRPSGSIGFGEFDELVAGGMFPIPSRHVRQTRRQLRRGQVLGRGALGISRMRDATESGRNERRRRFRASSAG